MFHRVGIVASYSYNDTVNPKHKYSTMTVGMKEDKLTVNLVLVLHDQERVIVEVTEEFDIRLHSPVVLVLV